MNGAELICATLHGLGTRAVFGLPGSQNIALYDAFKRHELRAVVASDEGAAAFMACGYARASGKVGVLSTIPGPGFVYALAGVVEARHDSTPLLWLTLRQEDQGRAFQLQRIDQTAIAAPVVKRCIFIDRSEELEAGLGSAYELAAGGEPGPVLVEVAAHLLTQPSVAGRRHQRQEVRSTPDLARAIARLTAARRPLIYAGQGAQGAHESVRALAREWNAPALLTSSGRGVLSDTDPLAFVRDFSDGIGNVVPELIDRADLVLVLGCKFSHNGSAGGRLILPTEKLVRVDASTEVLAANYSAAVTVACAVEDAVPVFRSAIGRSQWTDDELQDFRARLLSESSLPIEHEPRLVDCDGASLRALFAAMAEAYGARALYTTDAGLHQALVRRYAVIREARGLLCPSDFQSMGFGLPAGIGAAIALPNRPVIACVGDGALILEMGDLLSAMREAVDLTVIVFNDGVFGLIRRQQLINAGRSAGVDLVNPDYAALAAAVGCSYFPLRGDVGQVMRNVARAPGLRLVEAKLSDAPSLARQTLVASVRDNVRRHVPDSVWQTLKRALRN